MTIIRYMRKRTPDSLISNRRIFELMREVRGRPDPKALAHRKDLAGLRVFRCENGNYPDHAIVVSGHHTGTDVAFLAIAHNNSDFASRKHGVSRMFYELPIGAESTNERFVCPIDLPDVRSLRFSRAMTDPYRLVQPEVDFGTLEQPDLNTLGVLREGNDDYVRHTLVHSALFSFGLVAEKTAWEKDFEIAIDLVEAAKFTENADPVQRIDWLMTAKDLFKELKRPTLAADCLYKIAKIIADDPGLCKDATLQAMATGALDSAQRYYAKIGDSLALEHITQIRRLLAIHLAGTKPH